MRSSWPRLDSRTEFLYPTRQPDLHRPPRPPIAALPLLERTQELRQRAAPHLHRRRRRRRPQGARRAQQRLGEQQDPHRSTRRLGASLGPCHPLPRLPRRDPPHHLHDQQRREPAHAGPQDDQDTRPLPQRRRCAAADLARDHARQDDVAHLLQLDASNGSPTHPLRRPHPRQHLTTHRYTEKRAGSDAQAALARPGRYQTVRDNLRVKDVRLGAGDTVKRFVVCHNPAEAERDMAERDAQLARLEAELARIETARRKAKTDKARAAHTRAECALRDHPTLSRYLRQTPSGRLLIDRRKVASEERLDGKYLLSSSDPDLSAEEIALGYKNLREAERSFRDLKTTLELRPVFHRLEHRIRAHVVVCWLALLLIRIAERKSGQSWRRIATELQRLHLVTLEGEAGTVQQTTQPSDTQRTILAALEIEPPPRITALEPA